MNSSGLKIKFDDQVERTHQELVAQYIARLESSGIPAILSPEHLSKILQIRLDQIYAISNSPECFYREYYARKKSGGRRKISAPLPLLLFVQKWVLKNILEVQPVHPAAKAYLKKSSIKQNARFHRKQNHLFKSDVKNFFGSIPSKWVFDYFSELGYSAAVSMLLTAVCCKSNSLPQGAATSGYLSNIYMREFDEVIFSYCRKKRLRYTRYADDISVSGSEIEFAELASIVDKELRKKDLKIHYGKTRLVRPHQRQKVTGVVVNEHLSPGRDFLRALRQDLYYIDKYGIYEHSKRSGWSNAVACLSNVYGRLNHALFLLDNDETLRKKKKDLETVFPEMDFMPENHS